MGIALVVMTADNAGGHQAFPVVRLLRGLRHGASENSRMDRTMLSKMGARGAWGAGARITGPRSSGTG